MCPYLFKTSWQYADPNRPGWKWVDDISAKFTCEKDPCSVADCGFNAICVVMGDRATCECDKGYSGNSITFPVLKNASG